MRLFSFSACFAFAALLFVIERPQALAVLPLPEPQEDVTKLTRPTISYKYQGNQIRLIDWDGKNDRLWMGDGKAGYSGGVEWSPDGKRAAAVVFDKSDWSYAPHVLNLETGAVQNLLEWLPPWQETGAYIHLSWSPDGNWLALIAARQITNVIIESDIYKVNVHNGNYVRLTHFPRRDPGTPTWSQDGKKIAFDALKKVEKEPADENREIYVMNADGSNIVNLTNHPEWDEVSSWSPDGKAIVFKSYRDVHWSEGGGDLYIMDPGGLGLERLTFDKGFESGVRWSPDSQWIVYRNSTVDTSLVGIYRMHVASKETVIVKRVQAYSPTWVLAGKSRFLSVDPADKKKAQWGALKEASGSPNNQTSQDNGE